MSEKCPYALNRDHNTAVVIYGYTDDGDQELNDRDGKDLYLAGCVPDSYGINVVMGEGDEWYYPANYCYRCHKFFNYMEIDKVLGVSFEDIKFRKED